MKDQLNELEMPELLGHSGRKEQKAQKKDHASVDIPCKVIKTNSQITSEQKLRGHSIYQRTNQ